MKPIIVIGSGMSKNDFTPLHFDLIEQSDILIGGGRILDSFESYSGRKVRVKANLNDIKKLIGESMASERIVVLASGDPLLFGIGATLVKAFGPENVRIYPNISSVSMAFSRIGEPWHDANIISFHGREIENDLFDEIFSNGEKIAVLTDPVNSPDTVARRLMDSGFDDYNVYVCEHLGQDDEKVALYSTSLAAKSSFKDPNIMIVMRDKKRQEEMREKPFSGMPEHLFSHGRGLITKPEIRVLSLAKLRLKDTTILWDLGAGSGSVSIEASAYIGKGKIFAVEKNNERIGNIEANRDRFHVKNLHIVHADLPGGMDTLPDPDSVFIGGGGRDLKKIIKTSLSKMKQDAVIVINTVLLKSMDMAVDTLNEAGFLTDVIQVQVNRGKDMPWSMRFEAENPVWIISGEKRQ